MKKHTKLINTLSIILICGIAVACGFFAGQSINSKYFTTNSLANIDPKTLMDDVSKISYEGKTPDQLTGVETFLVSFKLLEECSYYKRTSIGTVDTSVGVKQIANSESIKQGETYFQQFYAYSSMIKTAGKLSFKKGDDITIIQGNANGEAFEDVCWTDKQSTYSYDEYTSLLGRDPTNENAYIVSSKTIVSTTPCEINGNEYTYTLTLDPSLSTLTSRKEISYRTDINENTINFKSIIIKFTTDENFKILKQEVSEEYSMKYSGINVTAYTNYKINFEY